MVWFFFLLPFLAFRFFIPSPYNRVPCPQTSVKRTLLREHHFLPIAGLAIDLARGGKVLLHPAVWFLPAGTPWPGSPLSYARDFFSSGAACQVRRNSEDRDLAMTLQQGMAVLG